MSTLHALAGRVGIRREWWDVHGQRHEVGDDTLRHLLAALGFPATHPGELEDSVAMAERALEPKLRVVDAGDRVVASRNSLQARYQVRDRAGVVVMEGALRDGTIEMPREPGYYSVECDERSFAVAVAPSPSRRKLRRGFGLAAQIYSLRHAHDGGIGDFEALARLGERAAARGADALALSPVHATFASEPWRASPYSPSSRLCLSILHIDPATVLGADVLQDVLNELAVAELWARAAAEPLIDWSVLGALRVDVLRALYLRCKRNHRTRFAEFESWRKQAPAVFAKHALFESIDATTGADRAWPAELATPHAPAVRAFAAAHADEIEFHCFAQWLACSGLADAQARVRAAGMRIGLIADLAVGVDPRGSDAWQQPDAMLRRVSIGAPPDLLAPQGQSWGLTTYSPTALQREGYLPFIELVRSTLACAGGMRLDHVIGIERLWLVPHGAPSSDGAYVSYPRDDLFGLLALEAHLTGATLIGEDLGTVPDGFRDRLAQRSILGMSVLMFERDEHGFRPARAWRDDAAALTSTHDLPTLAGWWEGRDLAWRRRLDLLDEDTFERQREERQRDRTALFRRMREDAGENQDAPEHVPGANEFVDAAVAHVARTPAALAMVPLEDICGAVEQPNLPGTVSGHPNWQRRLPADVDVMLDTAEVAARIAVLAARGGESET